jgi:hypothetical protein
MGEASELVGKAKDDHFPVPVGSNGTTSIISRMTSVIDDLDRAVQVKEHDFAVEGSAAKAENHFKLGMLRAADSLTRRARAILQDYGADLAHDVNPTVDEEAASGEDLEEMSEEDVDSEDDEEEEEEDA